MLLLTLTLIVIWGADVKGQRVYATRSTASTTVTGSPSSSVTNTANCVSGIGNSAIQPTATPYTRLAAAGSFGVLGGALGVAFVNLQFDAPVPANTIVFAKIIGGPTATQSSTITGAAYNGGGSAVAGSNFYLLMGGDGSQYVAVYATATFNTIRITLNAAGSGAAGIPPLESVSLDVQYAYYNTNGSSAPLDCGLAIGTAKGGNGTVDNMQQAVDGNLTTYSTITPAALLSSVDQYFFFSALSNPTDEIKVTLSVPPMALTLGLANTITVSAFNGSNPTAVWTRTLGTLLSLDLLTLLGNGTPVTTSIKPGVAFDRLTVNSAAVLSLLFSLRVHEVQITSASPVLTVPAPTICANTTTTLAVTAPALSTAKWYDAATAGNLLTTGNSFTTPILTATTTYYVAIAKNGCTEESVRIPVLVTVLPVPILPAITGTFSTCVGSTTPLANTTAGGSWSSASPAIATVNSTGQVTGITAGTSLITYSVPNPNGCPSTITTTVTINALPTVNAITGTLSACIGKTTLLSSTTPLGTWSSASPAVATVNSSGLVTGISAGTAIISYSLTNGNGCVATQTASVTINPLPTVNAITGTVSACVGKTTTLSSTTTGGVWTSATPAVATIDPASGLITGITAGTSIITYTVTNGNGCVATQTASVTINPLPTVNAITGTLSACVGKTTTLSSTTTGGVWTSATPAIATIDPASGLVTGITAGTSLITYSITGANGCVATQTATVTINPLPTVNAITGTLSACVGKTTTLSSTTTGGVWTSATPAVATIDPASGLITGITAGTSIITYTVTNGNGCVATKTTTVTINALPTVNAITGILSTCIGSTTALSNTTSLGIWSSATPSIATVNSSGLVTGVTAGTATINYTVTNGNSCVTLVSTNVVVHLQPSIPAISAHHLCLGQAIDLNTLNPADGNGTTGGTYVWSASPGGAALSSTTVSPPLNNTTYYLRYTKDGCFSDSSVLISVTPKPPTPHVILN